jgi:hypothetical protein
MDVDLDEVSSNGSQWMPLQTRRSPTEHFFEAGDLACCSRSHKFTCMSDVVSDAHLGSPVISCHQPQCNKTFNRLFEYEMHYNTVHRYVCSKCHRSFPTQHLTDIHVLEWHDTVFQLQVDRCKMFQCLVESCPERFETFKHRTHHMVVVHKYPSSFRFAKILCESSVNSALMDCSESDALPPRTDSAPDGVSEEHGTFATHKCNARVPKAICFGRGVVRGFQQRSSNKWSPVVTS